MQISRAQIQIFTMRAATATFVMTIREQDCAAQVHQQSEASDPDSLVKMNFQRNEQPVHRFAGHQQRHD